MDALSLISPIIPPLKVTDTPEKALIWMDEFRLSDLPIIKDKQLIGIVSEGILLDLENVFIPFDKQNIVYKQCAVNQNDHLLKVIKTISEYNVSLVPVLDDANLYLGAISFNTILLALGKFSTNFQNWSIIVLEIPEINYSLVEIAQIVETNQAKILSLQTSNSEDNNNIEVTLSINTDDLTFIIESFYRYQYVIKDSYHLDKFKESNEDRFNFLLNYIKI